MKVVIIIDFDGSEIRVTNPGVIPRIGDTLSHRYYTYRIVNIEHAFDLDLDVQTIHMQTEIVK